MRVLSVDLGTSNTVAVLSAHGRGPRVVEVDGSATMSSAVFAGEDGVVLVGRDAERRAKLDPTRFEPNPKRRIDDGTLLLGDTVLPVTDALATVLRRVAEETTRQLGGDAPDEVRLTHPAQWGPVRRNTLLSAARQAGFGTNLVLVPEPVAAAAHFASFPEQHLPPGQALAVYDLGAGTFDCAIVGATQHGFAVLAEGGLPDLGGLDVDQALLEHVGLQVSYKDPAGWQRLLRPETTADRRARRALSEDVKQAKEALSRYPQTEVPMPEPFGDVLVTRTELEALVRPNLLRSVELMVATVRSAGVQPGQLAGVYLVGGSSRMPLAGQLIGEQLRIVPTTLDQPETAVALGTHHVSAEGLSMRTEDLSRRLGQPSGPGSGGFPSQVGYQQMPAEQSGYPGSGPQQVLQPGPAGFGALGNRPLGPQPAPQHQPVPHQPAQQPGYQPSGYPPLPPAGRGRSRKPVVITLLVAVLLLLGAGAVGLYLLNRDTLPTAEDCRENRQPDRQGFTPCIRQLAGSVPRNAKCAPGAGDNSGLADVGGLQVTCQLRARPGEGSRTVTYLNGEDAKRAVTRNRYEVIGGGGDRVAADWKGNGLRGRYEASVSGGVGAVVFTVSDRPLVGVMVIVSIAEGNELTPDGAADYFENNLLPGT